MGADQALRGEELAGGRLGGHPEGVRVAARGRGGGQEAAARGGGGALPGGEGSRAHGRWEEEDGVQVVWTEQ